MELKAPYLLFLGDATDPFSIKLARGVVDWRPELAMAEHKLPAATISTGIKEMSIKDAADAGAKSFVIGLANSGGTFAESWMEAGSFLSFSVQVRGQDFEVRSRPGVFSWDRLDRGTARLLEVLKEPPGA